MTQILVVGTTNLGKQREFQRLLAGAAVAVRSLADYGAVPTVEEDGRTFAENARKKALAFARHTGMAALADDSGLEVDALDGAPGVLSARYAAPAQGSRANIDKLLRELVDVPPAQRGARFRCVVAVALPSGAALLTEGTCEGRILAAPRGHGGFGYDPVFFYEPAGQTFAEIGAEEKNRISHRARAVAALLPELDGFLRNEG